MQIWAESGKSALPICNYSQILYQFLAFTQNLKRSPTDPETLVLPSLTKHIFFAFNLKIFHCSICWVFPNTIVFHCNAG